MYDPNYLTHETMANPPMMPMDFQGHGDGYKAYYDDLDKEESPKAYRTPLRKRRHRRVSRSSSRSDVSKRSNSKSRSRSRSHSKSPTTSGTKSKYSSPSFMDAFRIHYLSSTSQNKNTPRFLATKKKQDHIQELLKSDGLGSKRWIFYPRHKKAIPDDTEDDNNTIIEEISDRRIKIDGNFFRKYKNNKKVNCDSPVAKLKRWELNLYKKFGFIQAV